MLYSQRIPNKSNTSRMDVVIVKTDTDYVTKYANDILDQCNTVLPSIKIVKRSVNDVAGEKRTLPCKKLLFLVADDRENVQENVAEWVNSIFPQGNDILSNVLVIFQTTRNESVQLYASVTQDSSPLRTIAVKALKDVFKWWPHVLDFIYKRKPTGHKVYLGTETPSPGTYEQSQLTQNVQDLLHFNNAEVIKDTDHFLRGKVAIMVLGRSTIFSETMKSNLRLLKINEVNVIFFLTHETRLSKELKRISTVRYMLSQHMEGILFIMRNIAMESYTFPPLRTPLIQAGPLNLNVMSAYPSGISYVKANWFPYPYGLGETISLQARCLPSHNKVWVEISKDIPATQRGVTTCGFAGQLPTSMSDYRLVTEHVDGNLSPGIKPNYIFYSSPGIFWAIRSGVSVQKFDNRSVHMKCPFCGTEMDTIPSENNCCCIPFIRCSVTHTCSSCEREVRKYNGLQ